MNFDNAFTKLIGFEGGFSDDARDPGGKTRYGITEAVAREVGYRGDMRELPVDLAKRIYAEQYWKPLHCDELPDALRYIVFDAGVNSGIKMAATWLQQAVGADDDGVIGPQTLAAAKAADPQKAKDKFLATRLLYLAALPTWPAFGRGWARRVANQLGDDNGA